MVYGDQKARDMARSLLPSRGRKRARLSKAFVHRSARRQARLEVARLELAPEVYEDLPGPGEEARQELRDVVQCRRYADKVNPFIRWATAITRHLPRESRLSHVRGCIPKGIIGEHALFHLEGTEAFEDPFEREWRRKWRWQPPPKPMDRGEHARLLRAVLEAPGGHRTFNRWMQGRYLKPPAREPVPRPGARTLRGLHDVLPFLDAVGSLSPGSLPGWAWRSRSSLPEGHLHMDEFLQAFKRCRGDVEATLEALGVELAG